VFVAIVVQALPFLLLGVLVSGAITALVSAAVLARFLGSLLTRSPPASRGGGVGGEAWVERAETRSRWSPTAANRGPWPPYRPARGRSWRAAGRSLTARTSSLAPLRSPAR
jgi:hypothetical protein